MLGESCSHTEIFGDGGRHEDLRFGQMRRDDTVDDLEGQSRVGECGGTEFRPLFQRERRRRCLGHTFRRQFDVSDDRGFAT